MNNFNEYDEAEVIEEIKRLSLETEAERNKEKSDKVKITKLMYEQMLKGLYLQQNPNMLK